VGISGQVCRASLPDVCTGNFQRGLVGESRLIRTQAETHNRSEIIAVQGSPCAPAP
jgi:hypothetical protein